MLQVCHVDEDKYTVTIPSEVGVLPRNTYEEVDNVLQRIGGKWSKKLKAHQFPYNPAPLFKAVLDTKELPPKNPTAFYPTPKSVVKAMIELSQRWICMDGARVLEPSAGTGAIAKAIKEAQSKWTYESAPTLHCCEVLDVNRTALKNQGFKVVADDFLKYQPKRKYDAILMNPPFSVEGNPTAYVDHINHAWEMLKEGGYLVAIVPPGWIFSENSKKIVAFRDFVLDNLEFEEIGAGAFKDSGTMVNTFLLYEGKCTPSWRLQPYNGWRSHHAWNASLCLDNDWDAYQALTNTKTMEEFSEVCRREVKKLVQRQHINLRLTDEDIKALYRHYHESED